MYNTYKNRHNQNVPKSLTIENSEEVRLYLKGNYRWAYEYSKELIHEDHPYLIVGISVSRMGNVYLHISTGSKEDIERYNISTIKDFTDFESFKKYLNWASNLPKYIINKK